MLDDFKPRKPAGVSKYSPKPQLISATKSTIEPPKTLDEEIGDAFVSPDEVAEADDAQAGPGNTSIESGKAATPTKSLDEPTIDSKKNENQKTDKPLKDKTPLVWWPLKSWTRKQWLIAGGGLALLLAIIVTVLFLFVFNKSPAKKTAAPPKKAIVKAPAKPTTVVSKLSGLPISPKQAKTPLTGIMIENSLEARPQSGLDEASVVYEAIAEGGITRFLAIFGDNQPAYLGPIRSSRPYYLRWLLPYDASYAHVGGSPDALSDIHSLGVKDLDQFYNDGAYHRINSRDAPHNVYTSLADLLKLEQTKGYTTSKFTGLVRKKEKVAATLTASSIDFTISGPAFSVHYDYYAAKNNYQRSEGGEPHMVVGEDGVKTQLQPKVVVALIMNQSYGGLDASGAYYTQYDTVGSGDMFVFQDGVVAKGTWSKANDKSQFIFSDETGKVLPLNPGQTWISVLGLTGDVGYK